jgi:uncharacterized protein DUF4350
LNKIHLALLVALIAILGMVLTPMLTDPPGLQTSYSYTPSGSRAFRELAAKVGRSVQAWHHLPAHLYGSGNALLMLEPDPALLANQAQYRQDLLDWVAKGNHLLLIPATTEASVATVMKRDIEILTPLTGFDQGIQAIFHDIDLEFSLAEEATYSIRTIQDLRQTGIFELALGDQSAQYEIHGKSCRSILEYDTEFAIEGTLDGEVVMLGADWGEGGLHVLTLPQLFRNRGLAVADHAAAALAVLDFDAYGGPYSSGELLIDEFFHGLPAMTSIFDLVVRPPFHFFALQLLLFLALLLWAILPRPVPVREQLPPSRRSKAEHLDAMGRLLANGSEGPLVVQRLSEGLREDLHRAYHLHRELSTQELVKYLQRFDADLAGQYQDLLAHSAELVRHPRIAEQSLLDWGRRLARIRKSILSAPNPTHPHDSN